jgi:hypothetical protein
MQAWLPATSIAARPLSAQDADVSEHLPKGKVDSSSAGQRMLPIAERSDTVIDEASGTAPHHDVTAFQSQAAHWIGPTFATPQEYGRQAERNGDDRSPGILLVAVLMKTEFGPRDVAIDQASVRIIVREPGPAAARAAMSRNALGIAGQATPVSGSTGS